MDEEILKEYYIIIKNKILNFEFQSALKNITKLLSNFPDNAMGYYYKGVCEFALDNYEDSKKSYLQALKLDITMPKAYFNLGVCYYMLEKYDKALINIGKALIIFSKQKELRSKDRCLSALSLIESERK